MQTSSSGRGFPDYLKPESMSMWAYAELVLKLEHALTFGTIARANYRAGKVRVLIGKKVLTEWLPWLSPRAGANVTWNPLDIGEEVLIISPAGNLNNGFVVPSANTKRVGHGGNNADVTTVFYRARKRRKDDAAEVEDTEEAIAALAEQLAKEPVLDNLPGVKYAAPDRITLFDQTNRRTAKRRIRTADHGSLSFEIHDFARVFMDKSVIELRVKGTDGTDESQATRMVITKDDIAFYIKGEKTSLVMAEDHVSLNVNKKAIQEEWKGSSGEHMRSVVKNGKRTTAHHTSTKTEVVAEGNGVLRVTKDQIETELRTQQVRTRQSPEGFEVRVKESVLALLTSGGGYLMEARIPGSSLVLTPSVVTLLSPMVMVNSAPFRGVEGIGSVYLAGVAPGAMLRSIIARKPNVKVEPVSRGGVPFMPTN